MENLIDMRLDLIAQIQAAVEAEPDLVFLNQTDINPCMLVFDPERCQAAASGYSIKFSAADREKIRFRDIRRACRDSRGVQPDPYY